jgi:hypothetical protein
MNQMDNQRARTSLGSELNVDDLSRTPKLPLRPHTTDDSAFLEDDLQLGKDKERPQQPTLEDLGILAAIVAKNYVLLRKTLQGRTHFLRVVCVCDSTSSSREVSSTCLDGQRELGR